MSISSDFWKELKKIKEEEEKLSGNTTKSTSGSYSQDSLSSDFWAEMNKEDTIAPFSTVGTLKNGFDTAYGFDAPFSKRVEAEKPWYKKGLFEDGYDFGDVTKTILGISDEKKLKTFVAPDTTDTLEQLKQKMETEEDTGEQLKYTQMYNQMALAQYSDTLSKTQMNGQNHTVLEEIEILANMKSGKEKDKRKQAVLDQMESLGMDTAFYSHFAGDGEFDWGTFGKWVQSGIGAGLNTFNKGLLDTADVLVGGILKGVGWENNPISKGAEYYDDLYSMYRYNANLYAEKLGGNAWNFGTDAVEGTIGALPNALLMFMTGGASATATTSSLATQAAMQSGNFLTKAGLTAETMMKNPQFWMSFARTLGSDYKEAKEDGASDVAASIGSVLKSMVNAGIEIGPDGGSGIQGLDDALKKGGKPFWEWVESSIEEGGEEVLQKFVGEVISKFGYGSDKEILNPIEYAKEGTLGVVSGMALGGGQTVVQSGVNAYNEHQANKLTEMEQSVADKLVEKEIARKEAKGEKVSADDKATIKKRIEDNLRKGYLSADAIEEAIGGEVYETFKTEQDNFFKSEAFQNYTKSKKDNDKRIKKMEEQLKEIGDQPNTVANSKKYDSLQNRIDLLKKRNQQMHDSLLPEANRIMEMKSQMRSQTMATVKDSRLAETYRELERKKQKFEVDVNQYTNENAKKTVQAILDSGLGDNSHQFHDTVDWLAKISEQKGVTFDLTNNAKLKGTEHYKEGYITHGFVDDNGNVMLNMDSDRVLHTTVGHEITHTLEKAGLYKELSGAIRDYAISKEGLEAYNARIAEAEAIYKGKKNTTAEGEVTADLIGEYLFTDADFVNSLSTQNRNTFQKIYDEIKYLWKVATAGSVEKRELEKVKKIFDKAWRENVKGKPEVDVSEEFDAEADDVQYSVSVDDKETLDFLNEQIDRGEYDPETNPEGGYYVTYKSMSFWGYDEEGNAILRSPMAEYVDGKLSGAYLIPKDKSKLNWYKATETIDEKTGMPSGLLVKAKLPGKKDPSKLVDTYVSASENQHLIQDDWKNLYFNLKKKVYKKGKWEDSDVPARYNPYEHSSNSMLNDQFSTAYLRDNLVTVKMYVPVSENVEKYRAKWSKDPTGWTPWKTGIVASKIKKQKGYNRDLYLSRYAAPVEIVPDSEVAQAYKSYIEGTDVAIPDNVVSPNLLKELKKAGVPIEESGKVQYSMTAQDKAKMDEDYFKAIESGDEEVQKHLVREYARASMPNSKLVDENGNLREVYHGTNTGDFTVFNPDFIGMSSGDDGFFGRGFYFAYSKGEASYYGRSRVIPAYLNLTNPFNFDTELQTYNGKKALTGKAPDAVALMNFADKFPDIAMHITLGAVKNGESEGERISVFEFAKAYKDVIENKKFEYQELVNEYGETETLVTADPQVHTYEYNGETHSYRDYGFQKRWYGTPNELDVAYEYLSEAVYSYLDIPRRTNVILDNNMEFTEELKRRGYDGTIQSEYGDEAVVFESSQIKSAKPVTYDDEGKVIPLSKRFDSTQEDIRYSMTKQSELDKRRNMLTDEYEQTVGSIDQYWFGAFGEWFPDEEFFDPSTMADYVRTMVANSGADRTSGGKKLIDLANQLDRINNEISSLSSSNDDAIAPLSDAQIDTDKNESATEASTTDDAETALDIEGVYKEFLSNLGASVEDVEKASFQEYVDKSYEGFMPGDIALHTFVDDEVYERTERYETEGMDSDDAYNRALEELSPTYELASQLAKWYRDHHKGAENLFSISKKSGELGEGYIPSRDIGYTDEFEDFAPVREDVAESATTETVAPEMDTAPEEETTTNATTERIKELESIVENKDEFFRKKAHELYKELCNLRKGVKASENLGFLLDYGYEWRTVKKALLNIIDNPGHRVDYNSAIESIARELINEDYEDVAYELSDLKAEASKPKVKKQTTPKVEKKTAPEAPKKETKNSKVPPQTEGKKKFNLWKWSKEHLLDNGMVFEDLSKATGNRRLEAKWNFIRNAEASAQHLIGEGANGVKALKTIKDELDNRGKTEDFHKYMYHKLNTDTMSLSVRYKGKENIGVFGDEYTYDDSLEIANKLEKQNPQFEEWADEIYAYNNHLRDMMVEAGLITRETANLWAEMYPHYVPIRREGFDLFSGTVSDEKKTGVNAPLKGRTGGSRKIEPLFNNMAQRTIQTYKAIAKNNFGVELMNTLDSVIDSSDADGVDVESLLTPGQNGKNPTFAVYDKGKRVTFEITDEMYEALKPKSEILSTSIPGLSHFSKLFRGLTTTYSPVFSITNPIRDIQDVLMNSQHPGKTYANIPNAIKQMATNGDYYKEYIRNGGQQNTYFDNEKADPFRGENRVKKFIDKVFALNEYIEMTPRLAEYIVSRESGRGIEVSMLDAARVTTNFSAGGDLTKFANRNGCTFLNASVQGAIQNVRNVREANQKGLMGWVGLATRVAIAGLPVLILNNMKWDDDEDYEELSDYVKQNYYVIGKYDDGRFIRIPKGRTLAVIQNAFEQVQNVLTGDDEVDFGEFLKIAAENLAPNNPFDNNIFAPIKQVIENETWYGEDLVPYRLQNVPAEEQYDEKTDSFSRAIGEAFGWSPYKINYLLNQYSGGVGDIILPMMTPKAESADDSVFGKVLAPFRDKFTTDSVLNSQVVSDFYDKKEELDVLSNSQNASELDKFKAMYMTYVSYETGDLYAEKRKIQNSNLPNSVKYEKVRDIQAKINDLMEEAMSSYNNPKINGLYAEVGSRRFNLDPESGNWYEIKPKKSDGTDNYYYQQEQKVTKGLGISYGEYWNNRDEYDFAYNYPEKSEIFKDIGITYQDYKNADEETKADYNWAAKYPHYYTLSKAITDDVLEYRSYYKDIVAFTAKDENGNSVSGLKKKRVIEYISNLDIEDGAKYVLLKSQYENIDDYNGEIFEYIKNKSSLTLDEKMSILKTLGFKVYDDGRVEWD